MNYLVFASQENQKRLRERSPGNANCELGLTFHLEEGLGIASIPRTEMNMITFSVPEISCSHCVNTITKAVKNIDATARVDVDLSTKLVRIQASATRAALQRAIQEAGYTVSDVVVM